MNLKERIVAILADGPRKLTEIEAAVPREDFTDDTTPEGRLFAIGATLHDLREAGTIDVRFTLTGELEAQHRYQARVHRWAVSCFGPEAANDPIERSHRLLEEVMELAQTQGVTREDAHTLVDYVFSRPVGEPAQEVGGSIVTLAALCAAIGVDLEAEASREVRRIEGLMEKIRAKWLTKPKGSPLPSSSACATCGGSGKVVLQESDAGVVGMLCPSCTRTGGPAVPGELTAARLDELDQLATSEENMCGDNAAELREMVDALRATKHFTTRTPNLITTRLPGGPFDPDARRCVTCGGTGTMSLAGAFGHPEHVPCPTCNRPRS